jgi:stearoyl-CoA desaturase (delta-9 desaturase)
VAQSTSDPKPAGFNWTTGGFIIGYHVALLVGLPFYFYYRPPHADLIVVSIVLLVLTEIGIGAAYHRFYAHRCYTLSKPVEAVLLFLATLATQGSALRWSHDHRLHHSFPDTVDDPYSIKRGFWHAHVLWLFEKSRPIDEKRVPDLLANRLVVLQHRFAGTLSMVGNFLVFLLIGWLVGDFLGAFVLAWWTRLLLSHHLTWFINSLCHCWGERTYSREHSSVDNYVLAVLTVGEGYHNFHHTFPNDYRNGVRWYHVDPTKWLVWCLSKLGLAGNLKRASPVRIKKRLLAEDRQLLLERVQQHVRAGRDELEQRIERLAESIQGKLGRQVALVERIRSLEQVSRDRRAVRATSRPMRVELRALRQSLRRDWKAWHRLCGTVLHLQPAV